MEELQEMSEAEKEIMEIIWSNGGSIYIAELLKKRKKMDGAGSGPQFGHLSPV